MIITSTTYFERILPLNILDKKKCIYPFLEGLWTLWAQDVDKDPADGGWVKVW